MACCAAAATDVRAVVTTAAVCAVAWRGLDAADDAEALAELDFTAVAFSDRFAEA